MGMGEVFWNKKI